jgi:hypothetical protein
VLANDAFLDLPAHSADELIVAFPRSVASLSRAALWFLYLLFDFRLQLRARIVLELGTNAFNLLVGRLDRCSAVVREAGAALRDR